MTWGVYLGLYHRYIVTKQMRMIYARLGCDNGMQSAGGSLLDRLASSIHGGDEAGIDATKTLALYKS